MNKQKLLSTKAFVKKPGKWLWLGLAIVSLVVMVFALRHNNLQMIQLRNQLMTADQQNQGVEASLNELRQFVYTHMNANTASATSIKPSVQLKYSYDRKVAEEAAKTKAASEQIYTDAQIHCEKLYPNSLSGGARVPCISEYVSSRGVQAKAVSDSLYKFDFISPRWAPDLAGLAMLAAGIFGCIFVIRLLGSRRKNKTR